jgi:glycosyltransferase involved in cell wall biosynthesis
LNLGYIHSTEFPATRADVIQIVQMCRAFAALGHRVTLLAPRAIDCATDDAALQQARTMFGMLPFDIRFVPRRTLAGKLAVLGTVAGTMKALREVKPDLVYTRNPWSVAFLPRTGLPFIYEAHESCLHYSYALVNHYLRRTIVRQSQRAQCRKIVAISGVLRAIWEGYGVPAEKLHVAHDGVDVSLFHPEMPRADARERVGISPENPAVIYTGLMRSYTGIEYILEAALRIRDLDYYLVGGSDDEVRHWRGEAEKKALENVHVIGRVPHSQIPYWQAAADILLMMWTWRVPHIQGFSPMKMFEYMAAGRLIVGPAFPAVTEVLEDGQDAFLFEPDNLEGLLAALQKARTNFGNDTMPRAARLKAETDYTWQARCRNILTAIA